MGGAWRADRLFVENSLHVINKPFSVGGCNINPLYHFNHCLSAGVSLDFIFDRSANLSASVDENDALKYSYPDFLRQCAAGISIRGELKMPIFSVNIGVGYNLCAQDSDLYGIYTSYTLKAFITDSLYLNVGYRLGTVAYAHNMMFGLGWRIKNTR